MDSKGYPKNYTKGYSALQHSAPEVVPHQDAPEVVPFESARHESSHFSENFPQPAARRSVHDKEVFHGSEDPESVASSYGSHEETDKVREGQKQGPRRYCGMRRGVMIAVVVILSMVIIGVGVGVGVGISLSDASKSNNKPLQAVANTGLATVTSGDTMYHYFQAQNGDIMENSYSNGKWSLPLVTEDTNAIVTSQAGLGSPLSAIIYPYNGQTYRQVFFVNQGGLVSTTNRTESGSWSPPTAISGNIVQPGSIALAACWDNQDLYGLRIYYASQWGYIQEIGGYFNGSAWNDYSWFAGSDPNSGVACAPYSVGGTQWMNVYFRNASNGLILQQFWDYNNGDTGWNSGSYTNYPAAAGSDIAICNDENDTAYLFYQAVNDTILLGIANPNADNWEANEQRQAAIPGSKLAAAWVDGGALVAFQNNSNDATMWVSDISSDGVVILDEAIL